jgi:hypothetical protein
MCRRAGTSASSHALLPPGQAAPVRRTPDRSLIGLARMLHQTFFLNCLLHATRITLGTASLRRMATNQE